MKIRFEQGELFPLNHEISSDKYKLVWQTSAGNVRFWMCDLSLCLCYVTCEVELIFDDTQIMANYS